MQSTHPDDLRTQLGIPFISANNRIGRKRARMLLADPHCHYCNEPLTFQTSTIDHIVPRSQGGANADENLVLACFPCNQTKGDDSTLKGGFIYWSRLRRGVGV